MGRTVLPPLIAACRAAGNAPRHAVLLQVCTSIVRGSHRLSANDDGADEHPLGPHAAALFERAVEAATSESARSARPGGLLLLVELADQPRLLPAYEVCRPPASAVFVTCAFS